MPQIGERVPISSSENPSFYNPDMICRALTIDEIEEMMEHWKVAALNAVRMGFDGIQIHAHAGYLMDQFMSEIWNHRTDKYGGSFEKPLPLHHGDRRRHPLRSRPRLPHHLPHQPRPPLPRRPPPSRRA